MPAIQRSSFSLEKLTEICERFYERDGFVKWADVGKALGVSRQAVQLRLRAAVEKGQLTPETVERWQSMTSRAAASRERARAYDENRRAERKLQINVSLTPENASWLRQECAIRKATHTDIVNGLITIARINAQPTNQMS